LLQEGSHGGAFSEKGFGLLLNGSLDRFVFTEDGLGGLEETFALFLQLLVLVLDSLEMLIVYLLEGILTLIARVNCLGDKLVVVCESVAVFSREAFHVFLVDFEIVFVLTNDTIHGFEEMLGVVFCIILCSPDIAHFGRLNIIGVHGAVAASKEERVVV